MEYLPTASVTVFTIFIYHLSTRKVHMRCKDWLSAKNQSNDRQNLYNICSSEYVQTSKTIFFSVLDNIVFASTNISFTLVFITVILKILVLCL
jgi:hypothetical protein